MMGIIQIEKMEFYAYHGHFEEEQVIGSHFLVDVSIETDCTKAAASDNLKDALDYQKVYKLIKEEMAVKSHLLENICKRILDKLFLEFDNVEKATIKIRKQNPSMGGRMDNVSLTMSKIKNEKKLA